MEEGLENEEAFFFFGGGWVGDEHVPGGTVVQ